MRQDIGTRPRPVDEVPASPLASSLLLPLAFIGGLTSLGIEFAASRLLAPFFGQSLFIWGTLIGLILIFLPIGCFAGGRQAGRYPGRPLRVRATQAAGGAGG